MREIKYKAFDKIKGEWLDSNYLIFQNGSWFEDFREFEDYTPLPVNEGEVVIVQFTGLTDVNGKEIYEGDIIETDIVAKEVFEYDEEIDVVVFVDGVFCLKDEEVFNDVRYPLHHFNENCKVIGNIYEHPHLIEGVK